MHVAVSDGWDYKPLPEYIKEAIREREALETKANGMRGGTIYEREARLGFLRASDLCHALVCCGIGEKSFPQDLGDLTYIVCGGAVTALNGGHTPDPSGRSRFCNMIRRSYSLLCASVLSEQADSLLQPATIAALLELFKPEMGGGHYEEGTRSMFISICRMNQYGDNIFSSYANLRYNFIKLGCNAIANLPVWAQADVWKIADGVKNVLSEVDNR